MMVGYHKYQNWAKSNKHRYSLVSPPSGNATNKSPSDLPSATTSTSQDPQNPVQQNPLPKNPSPIIAANPTAALTDSSTSTIFLQSNSTSTSLVQPASNPTTQTQILKPRNRNSSILNHPGLMLIGKYYPKRWLEPPAGYKGYKGISRDPLFATPYFVD